MLTKIKHLVCSLRISFFHQRMLQHKLIKKWKNRIWLTINRRLKNLILMMWILILMLTIVVRRRIFFLFFSSMRFFVLHRIRKIFKFSKNRFHFSDKTSISLFLKLASVCKHFENKWQSNITNASKFKFFNLIKLSSWKYQKLTNQRSLNLVVAMRKFFELKTIDTKCKQNTKFWINNMRQKIFVLFLKF